MAIDPCHCTDEEAQQLLCEILDAGTSPERAEEIRQRLAARPDCVERLTNERELRIIMQSCVSCEPAPVYLRERITTQIQVFRRG